MAPEREDFNLSGPLHLTARSAINWKNEDHRRSVAASLVQGVYVVERDRQKKREDSQALASPWWKSFNFQMLEQLEDNVDSSIFGAIYKFEPPASHSNLSTDGCPCYVIAFRGTLLKLKSLKRDLELDFDIIRNRLHSTSRFEIAMQAVRSIVASVGSSNVWLAGHSLGSAIALLAGKTMAKEGIFLETFLFNLPYPSVPIEKIPHKKVKHVIRGVGCAFRAGLALAMKIESGDPLKAWAPYLFVNQDDHICSEYFGYFNHTKKMEKLGLGGIERLATQLSLRGLFMGNESEPMHRIPLAYLMVNLTRFPDFKQAHGINQWWRPDLLLSETMLY
ncbi:hypothetical protein EZV62_023207 [Acer yangbiense]|uniref:Fungal lipase-type domain-containing protein n=1 Tax=Acer yangbiense TaxID=1000413 RepID=A0A5C7H167_9ROSI|nr:hypothetical protein EZV62_023207 [Acer yangbiense]